MSEDEELVKIRIDLPDCKETGGESFWAKPLGGDLYELRNCPWHAHDLNWGDVVRAAAPGPDRKPEIREVVRRGGHKTLRVIFKAAADEPAILRKLNEMGASHEQAKGRFYALDVRPSADYQAVCDYLSQEEQAGKLEYETGDSGDA